jgi:Domain of unknown function (DUF4188)
MTAPLARVPAAQRLTADVDGEVVVFLVGMRFRWRQVRRWLPLFQAMPRMLRELHADPASGFLGGESWIGNPTIMVQYWRSFEDLERYAHDRDRQHRPAWHAFQEAARGGADIRVWHETYRVRPGDHESVYVNMAPFGLARATRAVPATGRRATAAGRMTMAAPATAQTATAQEGDRA